MPGSILLATDGSAHAQHAADHAIALAEEHDATLHVLCVVDDRIVPEPGLSSAELATIAAEEHGHECVRLVRDRAGDSGVTVEGEHRHGVPHEVIERYADEIDATVVVVGRHGDHETHLGGVGRKLVEESDHEIVVVDD